MKELIRQNHLEDYIEVASAATSTEEIGNDIHYGTRDKLIQMGIPFTRRKARQITLKDYAEYDYLIGMDTYNIRNMLRLWGKDVDKKVHLLLEYAGSDRAIADPWYTGNFDDTYRDVREGCEALLNHILAKRVVG